jgi:hypothetical protein
MTAPRLGDTIIAANGERFIVTEVRLGWVVAEAEDGPTRTTEFATARLEAAAEGEIWRERPDA